jgi:hypothetical protein
MNASQAQEINIKRGWFFQMSGKIPFEKVGKKTFQLLVETYSKDCG